MTSPYLYVCITEKVLFVVHCEFQAYEEVQSFFSSSSPTSVFSDLTKALDSKCQAVEKLSALLKDLTVGKSRSNHPIFACIVIFQILRDMCKTNIPFDLESHQH